MTDVRLAYAGPPDALAHGLTRSDRLGDLPAPALLVSYIYLDAFQKHRHRYHFRDWAMDSGAFSAWNSGKKIDLAAYTDLCRELLATDPQLTEVFTLDVIGDWRGTLKNTEFMWARGVPAIPVYHVGAPEHVLLEMAKTYPKVSLGAAVGYRHKLAWAKQVFARIWPHKIHGLGFGAERDILALPWHSVDASNWELGPCAYGRWATYGDLKIRGSAHNLRVEVEHYLRIERRARLRWAKQMAELETEGPTYRLAAGGMERNPNRGRFPTREEGQPDAPSVRLAYNGPNGTRSEQSLAPPEEVPSLRLALAPGGGGDDQTGRRSARPT